MNMQLYAMMVALIKTEEALARPVVVPNPKAGLPKHSEWEEFGFVVPDDLCSDAPQARPVVVVELTNCCWSCVHWQEGFCTWWVRNKLASDTCVEFQRKDK